MHKNLSSPFFLLLSPVIISLISCGVSPEPINYGKEECEFCRMLISDNRYGAELITDKGKVYKFDSMECLIDFALVKNLIGDETQIFLVTDFYSPEKLIDAKSAFFVHNENFRSPMGLNVSAFGNKTEVQKFLNENDGTELSWLEVIEMVKQSSM